MGNNGIRLTSDTVRLTTEQVEKPLPGFIKLSESPSPDYHFSKLLASAYIKFTEEGRRLSAQDSVQSLISLAALHRELTEEAQAYLRQEVAFIYDDQQLQPLLQGFAAFRLAQLRLRYESAAASQQSPTILADLERVLRQRQSELDNVST